MTQVGSDGLPLRVAVVGSGPAGFYVAEHLLSRDDIVVEVDMYERLPTPYGLVRFGVAPDHEKIKNVTRTFDKKTAGHPRFQFFGNVEIGRHLTLDDLRLFYHQVCFASGAQTDRRMGIPGEDLQRSHAATEFVAWYNGHPDYRHCTFDLSVERAAVVGVGNVAVDVARILCRTPDELAKTDIADHALEALRESKIREVYMLGRRGPAQAAFTNPEVRELGQLEGADIAVVPDEVALDPITEADVEAGGDRTLKKKLEILNAFATRTRSDKDKVLTIRFLVSPVELVGNGAGQVTGMRLVKNELYRDEKGSIRPRATDALEDLPVELVFRSVGYHGVAIAGLPFHERWGVVPNDDGCVVDPERGPVPGAYVSGWIKRGPSGVIGTNKPDAAETAASMVQDVRDGHVPLPPHPDRASLIRFVAARQPDFVSYTDWKHIERLETQRGEPHGRPRVKFTTVEEAIEALRMRRP